MSYIIFDKLPLQIKRENTHKVCQNYPTSNDIFEHYNEPIRSVMMSRIPQERVEQYSKKKKKKIITRIPTKARKRWKSHHRRILQPTSKSLTVSCATQIPIS